MKRTSIIAGVLTLLLSCGPVSAQEVPQPKKVATRGVVFHVAGKEGGELWLAGSVHLLRPSDYPLPAAYDEAYSAAEQIVFEIPPSELQSPQAMAKMQRSILYLDGTELKDHLSPEGYGKVTAYAKSHGLSMPQLRSLKPWMLAQIIGMQEFAKQGFKPELGLDAFFETKAAKDGKPVKGLETVEFQLNLFSGLSGRQQEELLLSTVEDLSDAKEFISRLMAAWSTGNAEKLSDVMNDAMQGDPALGRALLYDRNKNWVDPIEAMMKAKVPTLVVVGAGHLCGKGSLVELLQKNGHKVVQR